MTAKEDAYEAALERAAVHTREWLRSMPDRTVSPRADADEIAAALGGPLPAAPSDPGGRRRSARRAGRTRPDGDAVRPVLRLGDRRHPAGRARRRLAGRAPGTRTPACATRRRPPPRSRRSPASWLLDLLGLPAGADVGFVTGGTMANFTVPGRSPPAVLAEPAGTSRRTGLTGAPRVHVLVGAERHDTVDLALRYLGLGAADRRTRRTPRAASCSTRLATRSARPDGGPIDRVPAGRQPAFRRLRPVRDGGRGGPRARSMGARRRRVRAVGCGISEPAAPSAGLGSRRLLGYRRAQDAQRALRLRHRDRRSTERPCGRRSACMPTT